MDPTPRHPRTNRRECGRRSARASARKVFRNAVRARAVRASDDRTLSLHSEGCCRGCSSGQPVDRRFRSLRTKGGRHNLVARCLSLTKVCPTTTTSGRCAKQPALGCGVAAHRQVGRSTRRCPWCHLSRSHVISASAARASRPRHRPRSCNGVTYLLTYLHTTHRLTHYTGVHTLTLVQPLHAGSAVPEGGLPQISSNARGGRNRSRAANSRRLRRPTSCNF